MEEKFNVQFLMEAVEFLDALDEKTRDKIIYNITKAKTGNDKDLFKKLTDEIWEFRTLSNKKNYRLFAFWDKRGKTKTIVIATHGILKTTDKIPKHQLEKSERIRKSYFLLNDN